MWLNKHPLHPPWENDLSLLSSRPLWLASFGNDGTPLPPHPPPGSTPELTVCWHYPKAIAMFPLEVEHPPPPGSTPELTVCRHYPKAIATFPLEVEQPPPPPWIHPWDDSMLTLPQGHCSALIKGDNRCSIACVTFRLWSVYWLIDHLLTSHCRSASALQESRILTIRLLLMFIPSRCQFVHASHLHDWSVSDSQNVLQLLAVELLLPTVNVGIFVWKYFSRWCVNR